jgi:hypothetical protein
LLLTFGICAILIWALNSYFLGTRSKPEGGIRDAGQRKISDGFPRLPEELKNVYD